MTRKGDPRNELTGRGNLESIRSIIDTYPPFRSIPARVNTAPTVVKTSNREGLYGRIPYRLSTDRREGCVSCGLSAAMDLVTDNEVSGEEKRTE